MNKARVIIAVVIVLLLGMGIYFFMNRDDAGIQLGNNQNVFPEGDPSNTSMETASGDSPLAKQGPYSQISRAPISGYTVYRYQETPTSTPETLVRFVDITTGHVIEIDPRNPNTSVKRSNTTIPKTFESSFIASSTVVMRFVDEAEEIISIAGSIDTEEGSLDSEYFVNNIRSFATSFGKLAYTRESDNGNSIILHDINTNSVDTLAEFPLKDITISWPHPETLLIATRPSSGIPAYAYHMNATNGSWIPLLRGVQGATTSLSPDRTRLLYSESTESTNRLLVRNLTTGEDSVLPFFSLAEKCTWIENDVICAAPQQVESGLPDRWYKGLVSFEDIFYRAPSSNKYQQIDLVFDPSIYALSFDAHNLQVFDNFLFFIDKNSKVLSLIDLTANE